MATNNTGLTAAHYFGPGNPFARVSYFDLKNP
jgi:hypothetical protein